MIIVGLILLGLCLGSFVNALVFRLYKQSKEEAVASNQQSGKKKPAELTTDNRKLITNTRYSIMSGRSMCVHCKRELAPKDLVPVLSWFLLRGKCRYCHKPISWQYPAVEALTAALFVASYVFWPGFQGTALETTEIIGFIIWLVILVGFVALIVYDLRHMLLPNRIIFPLLGLAFLGVVLESTITYNLEPLTSAALGAVVGGGLFYVLFQISNGAWIGGGDVKLGLLLGILIGGPWPALLMLFLASFLGTVYSVPLILTKRAKPKSRVPFGPFLITAAIIVQLFGQSIIDWYQNMYGV
jgi:prepilin signal peptidase PulO-like enzyme (type II secretory pathway)